MTGYLFSSRRDLSRKSAPLFSPPIPPVSSQCCLSRTTNPVVTFYPHHGGQRFVVAGSEKTGGDRRHGERLPAEIEEVADGRWLEGMQQLDATMMGRRSLMALTPSSSSRSELFSKFGSISPKFSRFPPSSVIKLPKFLRFLRSPHILREARINRELPISAPGNELHISYLKAISVHTSYMYAYVLAVPELVGQCLPLKSMTPVQCFPHCRRARRALHLQADGALL